MAAVTYRLNRPKDKTGKDKTSPVSILVSIYISADLTREISTGEKVLPKHWNGNRVTTKAKDYDRINDNLSRIERDLIQAWRDNIKDVGRVLDIMPVIVRGELSIQKKTVFDAFDKFIELYNRERDLKTVARFKTLLFYLKKFDEERYPVTFEGMNHAFYDDFKSFLYDQPNQTHPNSFFHNQGDYWIISKDKSLHPVGLFDDTVYKHVTNLKIFLKWARRREYNVHPSYPDWKIVSREYEPIALTLEELEDLEKADIKERHIDIGRDYLAMECRIGQRISDIKRFDLKDYENYKWSFKQYKGRGTRRREETMTVYFTGYCSPALMILVKHNWKMPEISEQKLNVNIRKACKMAGIDSEMHTERWVGNKCVRFYGKKYEFISTHAGRKTFITIGLQFMAPEIVMNLAGIKSYHTLKKYKAKSEPAIIQDHLNKLRDSIVLMKKAQ